MTRPSLRSERLFFSKSLLIREAMHMLRADTDPFPGFPPIRRDRPLTPTSMSCELLDKQSCDSFM